MCSNLSSTGLSFLPFKNDLRGGKRVLLKGDTLRREFSGFGKDRNGFNGVEENGVQ